VKDTWIKAIEKGNFSTWPGLTPDNVSKYLPKYDSKVKSHIKQHCINIRSIQPEHEAEDTPIELEQEWK
jgi:hypothetical protein